MHSSAKPYYAVQRLPPYANAIEWKRRAGREAPSKLIEIFTGSRGMAKASKVVDREKSLAGRYQIQPSALAVLPSGKSPSFYDWRFVEGLNVTVMPVGEPESDHTLLILIRLLIEAKAQIVCAELSGERLELFKPGEAGAVWRL